MRYTQKASAGRGVAANLVLGLGLLAVLATFVIIGLRAPNSIPGRAYYTVQAEFADGSNIASHADVKIAGKRVGQVLKPRFENGRTVVNLQIDAEHGPLRSDTTIRLRPKSAIGQSFVDVRPSPDGVELAEGARIPASQTSSSVALDRLLSAFDTRTRGRFQGLMRDLGTGTLGTGEGLNDAIGNGPMLGHLAAVTDRLADEPRLLPGFVRATADAAATFDRGRDDFAGMFEPAADVLGTLHDERDAVAEVFDTTPGALRATRANLRAADPILQGLGDFASAALPPLRTAPDALRRATTLMRVGAVEVPKLDRTLKAARRAVSPTLTLLRSAGSVAPAIDDLMRHARPQVDELAPRRCDVLRMTRNWQNLFAYGEPKAGGKGTLAVEIGTPDTTWVAGDAASAVGGIPSLVPRYTNPYPKPCEAWLDSVRLAEKGGGR